MDTFENNNDIFTLTVDYSTYKGNPTILFHNIADIINSFQNIDQILSRTFYNSISTSYELLNIEQGSIKIKIKQLLEKIPDEALNDLDIKRIIGSFLVRGKYKIINLINESNELKDIKKLDNLREDLLSDAKSNNILPLENYRKIENSEIIESLIEINTCINLLPKNVDIFYSNKNYSQKVNKNFNISNELLKMISDDSFRVDENTMTIKVKQPDYLSTAMWTFKIEGRKTIDAKFDDLEWLNDFHNRKIDVRPEDSLQVKMKITTYYDNLLKEKKVKYNIIKVLKILPYAPYEQVTFI